MSLYAESSAVLSLLLVEAGHGKIRGCLRNEDEVLTSELTLVECDRAIIRETALGRISEAEAAERRSVLSRIAEHWIVLSVGREVVDRARQQFPREPLRTLDAIHLATAILGRTVVPGLAMLSLDSDLRACARALGFDLLPVRP